MDTELRQMLTVTVVGFLLATAVILIAVPKFRVFGDRVSSYSAVVDENAGVFHVDERFIFHLSGTKHLIYRNWDAPVSLSDLDKPHIRILSVSCPPGTIPYVTSFVRTVRVNDIPLYKLYESLVSKGYPEKSLAPADMLRVLLGDNVDGVMEKPTYYYCNVLDGDVYCYFFSTKYLLDGRWIPERDALRQFPALPTYYVHKATKPEVGCVSTSGTLPPGDYEMRVSFDVYPKLHCDGSYCHANVSIAGKDHFDYQRVSVSFEGEDVVDVIRRPPSWFLSLFGLPGNQYLEIETLLKPIRDYRFIEYVANVRSRFNAARNDNYAYYYAFLLAVLSVFFVPILVFAYWWFFARDRPDPSVPDYITNVPNPDRKPWVVNAVFNGEAGKFDANAFAATLLDLKRRDIITISGSGEDARIEVRSVPKDLDEYERAVVDFLRSHSVGTAFVPSLFKHELSRASEENFKALKKEWEYIAGDSPLAKRVARRFIAYPRGAVLFALLAIVFTLFYPWISVGGIVSALSALALAVYSYLVYRLPPDVLGRWKNGYGKEYAQWQAFKRFLSDLSLIRKYSEQFLSMWQDWLVYGTALGVAENVLRALKEIRIPDVEDIDLNTYLAIRATADVIHTAYLVKSAELAAAAAARAAASGGGFGGGAGFGGGGGGAR